jgi:aspartate racemase
MKNKIKKIGLVGGISWVSTMDYYKFINEGINKKLGGLNFSECIIYSLNFGEVQAVGWTNSYNLLHNACESLKRSGVDCIVLCANTAHLFADQLQEELQLPIINIVEETAKVISKNGIKKVGLLGTKFTMEMDFYSNKLEEFGIEVIIPENQETRDYIQQTIKEELGIGLIKTDTKSRYIEIADELIKNGAECIILGCTEIPLLISQNDFPFLILDTAKIHSEAIVAYATSGL